MQKLTKTLKYCSFCVMEDRAQHGETYWHLEHQLPNCTVRSKHNCYLLDSKVPTFLKYTNNFYSAEQSINDLKVKNCSNEKEINFNKYLVNVFNSPIDINSNSDIGLFLHSKLSSQYLFKSKILKNISKLYLDYCAFFDFLSPMPFEHFRKIFNGGRFDCYEVCQIAFFEGIDYEELCNFKAKNDMNDIYEDISVEYNVPIELAKEIGDRITTCTPKSKLLLEVQFYRNRHKY